MKKFLTATLGSGLVLSLASCTPSVSQLQKTIEQHPEIVFSTIEKNPEKFLESVNKAAQSARQADEEKRTASEEKEREAEFAHPLQPEIDPKRAILGKADAPVTIVEYSDFECPYCGRGYQTMKQVLADYGDKVRVVYKELPLEFHPQALPAAKYFEAIALQSSEKAYKFHDIVFENQDQLRKDGEKFLQATAKKVGANMTKLKADINSEEVKRRIDTDSAEAKKFGFTGTPGFLINGVSLKGAYPYPEFKKIIDHFLNKK